MSAFIPKESKISSNLDYISNKRTQLLDVWKCDINITHWRNSEFIIKSKFMMRIIEQSL